jgi:hypothetical protein
MSSADLFNRDTLIAAVLHGGAATAACYYLFPGSVALDQRAFTVGLVLAVVTIAADKVFPRVSAILSSYNL